MPFEFPLDVNQKAGAVHTTPDGNDFYVPVNNMGANAMVTGVASATTAGTAYQLPNVPCRKITLIAKRANTGLIYIGGDSTVTSTSYGIDLSARDAIELEVSNANMIWITSSVSGEGISYIAIS